jgi:alcohol dehydrogenase/L-iditol 2-dehydrogenase
MIGLVNYAKDPHSVELRELPIPEIGEEDVLLSVQAAGICGSDLHQYSGKQSWTVNYPVVLGHEFAGIITKAGPRVRGFKEGDRVVSETAAVLSADSPFTRQGLYNLEPKRLGFGYGVNGAMAPFVKVPARCLHTVPASLSLEKAALTEPCCVAYNAVCVNSRIRPGDTVAIIGPAPIGLLCAVMARLAGAGHLLVIGIPAGQITKVGWGPQPLNFSLDQLAQKAATLQGSFSHNWPIWEKVISLLASGKINLDLILNRVSPLKEWREAFDEMHTGQIVKGVLIP